MAGRTSLVDTHEPITAEPWKAGSIYDTVELPWPMMAGSQYDIFRDLGNKYEVHCNLRVPRRIRAGQKFLLEGISVDLARWSGDDVTTLLRMHGHLTVKINDRLIHEAPLAGMINGYAHRVFEGNARPQITTDDDIQGYVKFQVSRAFPEPEVPDVKVEVVDETVVSVPFPRIVALLRKHGLPTEIKRRTQTHRWLSRKVSGLCLMKLTLHGQVHEPQGY